jgi:hypothetical protein
MDNVPSPELGRKKSVAKVLLGNPLFLSQSPIEELNRLTTELASASEQVAPLTRCFLQNYLWPEVVL